MCMNIYKKVTLWIILWYTRRMMCVCKFSFFVLCMYYVGIICFYYYYKIFIYINLRNFKTICFLKQKPLKRTLKIFWFFSLCALGVVCMCEIFFILF